MIKTLELYTPHDKQLEFHESKARYRVAALGRQSGKSTMAMNELVIHAWEKPNTHYWFLSPIYSQAKLQYRKLLDFLPHEVIKKHSDTELNVTLITESSIEYKSGEVLDRLRGATLDGVVIDEVRDHHKELWNMVIRPMLTTTQGWAAFISTPNGYDEFYDLYNMAKKDVNWKSFHAPSTCNPIFTQSELEAVKATMSEDVFAQEIMAEFREIGAGKAYRNHGEYNQMIDNPFAVKGHDYCHFLPIIVGMDFNVGLMVWVLGQRRGNRFHYVDEIALDNTDTEQMATVLAQRILEFYAVLGSNPKPDVILVGDASGNARRTSAVGQTDYTIIKRVLKENEIRFEDRTPTENPGVKDRINCINSLLKSADGTIQLTYNPIRCKTLKRDFERVKWKLNADGAFLDKSDPVLTHSSDAAGYPLCLFTDVFRNRPGTMRVILR